MRSIKPVVIFTILLVLSLGHVFLANSNNKKAHPADVDAFQSLSFSPSQRHGNPEHGDWPSLGDITRGLDKVSDLSSHVRLYTMSGDMDIVPILARERGLKVALGIWVDDNDATRTARETEAAIRVANQYPETVDMIFVGNESIMRGDASVGEITERMRLVRQATHGRIPVTTGEPWDIWLKYKNLAEAADIIGVHILPYWEGVRAEDAVAVGMTHYADIKRAYPKKDVIIAEFGWPSGLMNRDGAKATPANQAMVIRNFVAEAQARGIRYNIVEAFDQPWKTKEGDVGPYWGVMNASGDMKFPMSGPVDTNPLWLTRSVLGVLIAFALVAIGLNLRTIKPLPALISIAGAELIGAMIASILVIPMEQYTTPGLMISWFLGIPLLAILGITTSDRINELAELFFSGGPKRILSGDDSASVAMESWPKVSIHVPICNEDPDMVATTLGSMSELDYPNYEVLAVVNNTRSDSLAEAVKRTCEHLGDRFVFLNFPKISGYKAGALNAALQHTASDAEIIAVVDADYVVAKDWLRRLIPTFRDSRVALVQAPQEHRDEAESWTKLAMNSEYAGFFDAGMVRRNEDNAIIAHGTMLLLRRQALESVGAWGVKFICEDTELGLRLIEAGWKTEYTSRRYGYGILPDTLASFRRQRDRWAYGAMRIMSAHLTNFRPLSRCLTARQKYHFLTGWLHWISELVAVAMGFSGLVYAVVMGTTGLGLPPAHSITSAIIAASALNILHTIVVYTYKVRRGAVATTLAALAGLSLQMTVASAVFRGLVTANLPFHVTPKGKSRVSTPLQFIRGYAIEGGLGMAMVAAAILLAETNVTHVVEVDLFSAVLALQAVPFLVATAMAFGEILGDLDVRRYASFEPVAILTRVVTGLLRSRPVS